MQRGNLAPSRLPEVEPGLDAAEDSNTDISHSLQVTSLLLLQPQIRQCPFPGHPFPGHSVQLLLLPEQSSEMGRSGRKDSSGTATSDRLEQQQREGQTRGEGWGVASGH